MEGEEQTTGRPRKRVGGSGWGVKGPIAVERKIRPAEPTQTKEHANYSRENALSIEELAFQEEYIEREKKLGSFPLDPKMFFYEGIFKDVRGNNITDEVRLREDMELLVRISRDHEQPTARSVMLERFLAIELEQMEWFEGASTVRLSRFSDVVDQVDMVLQWKDEDGEEPPIRLLVDMTTARSEEVLSKKIQKTTRLGGTRYFPDDSVSEEAFHEAQEAIKQPWFSKKDRIKGQEFCAPVVILGVDVDAMKWIIGSLNKAKQKANLVEPSRREAEYRKIRKEILANHPIKFLLLEQAKVQLDRQVALVVGEVIERKLLTKEKTKHPSFSKIEELHKNGNYAELSAYIDEHNIAITDFIKKSVLPEGLEKGWNTLIPVSKKINSLWFKAEQQMKNSPQIEGSVQDWREDVVAHKNLTFNTPTPPDETVS